MFCFPLIKHVGAVLPVALPSPLAPGRITLFGSIMLIGQSASTSSRLQQGTPYLVFQCSHRQETYITREPCDRFKLLCVDVRQRGKTHYGLVRMHANRVDFFCPVETPHLLSNSMDAFEPPFCPSIYATLIAKSMCSKLYRLI